MKYVSINKIMSVTLGCTSIAHINSVNRMFLNHCQRYGYDYSLGHLISLMMLKIIVDNANKRIANNLITNF